MLYGKYYYIAGVPTAAAPAAQPVTYIYPAYTSASVNPKKEHGLVSYRYAHLGQYTLHTSGRFYFASTLSAVIHS